MDRKELLEIIKKAAGTGQQTLDLSWKGLEEFPSEIGCLTNLTTLNLSGNQLSGLPLEIGQLTNLTSLLLYSNELSSLPSEIGHLTRLTTLDLGDNELSNLSSEIGYLTNLSMLNLGGNQLSSLPPEVGQLTNLMSLYLNYNQLSNLPREIGRLTNLMSLYLGHNQLSSLPPEIGYLTKLTTLHLVDNQLSNLPPEIGKLTSLTTLDLGRNQFSSLPEELLYLNVELLLKYMPDDEGILLANNPWKEPPVEIVKKGKKAIRAWFEALKKEGEKKLNEVKVLLVGYGGVGKTSLVRKLTTDKFKEDEQKTHGVRITDWKIKSKGEEIKIHFWDYGGQGIMQATHRVFFSYHSLYILVIDARQESDPEEWLKNIESIGGNSPVMVVINKIDQHPFGLNETDLFRKYPNITGFYHISCKKGFNIESFKEDLIKQVGQVETRSIVWPRCWATVKERLGKVKKEYISYSNYEDICEEEGVKSESAQKELLGILHELGVMLHFPDRCLPDMEVLNPEWATGGIYKIINSVELKKYKGMLPIKRLDYVLNKEGLEDNDGKLRKYSRDEQRYITVLMNKFELCYELKDGTLFVPDLLTEQEPPEGLPMNLDVRFYFEYDFMPAVVMPRFMVQKQQDLDIRLCWRTGAVLKNKTFDSVAVVRLDKIRRRIYIDVTGRDARGFLSSIRDTIAGINGSFEKLPCKQWIPLPNRDELAKEYEELWGYKPDENELAVEYNELWGHEKAGKHEYFNGKLGKIYSVDELLTGIEKPEERTMKDERKRGDTHYHIHGDYVVGPKSQVDNNYGEIDIGGRVGKIEYDKSFGFKDINKFREFLGAIGKLSAEQQKEVRRDIEELSPIKDKSMIETKGQKLKKRLMEFGVGVASSLTASQLFEVLRNISW